jgi:N-acetylneuraminate synthase
MIRKADYQTEQAAARQMLRSAGISLPNDVDIEIADFGLGKYREIGLGCVVKVNEPEYCSKWLTLLPGQTCPWHHHKLKKETFIIHKGLVELTTDSGTFILRPGDQYTLKQGTRHTFTSKDGAVIEEISTHDDNADNYFSDPKIIRDTVIED